MRASRCLRSLRVLDAHRHDVSGQVQALHEVPARCREIAQLGRRVPKEDAGRRVRDEGVLQKRVSRRLRTQRGVRRRGAERPRVPRLRRSHLAQRSHRVQVGETNTMPGGVREHVQVQSPVQGREHARGERRVLVGKGDRGGGHRRVQVDSRRGHPRKQVAVIL